MKKIFLGIIATFTVLLSFNTISYAQDSPIYDASFNETGAFFANGTPITVTAGETDSTVTVTWNSGKNTQTLNSNGYIFGGGKNGTNYETSSITMESGKIAFIYGGGMSTDENSIAQVKTSNVVINGGSITESLYGGGLIFSTVNTTNVTVNNGTVKSVIAGGAGYAKINGEVYSGGTAEDSVNSKTRVNVANLTINGGTVTVSAWGGGQGYSYTGTANVIINSGNLKNAYLTAGGSNGHTDSAYLTINGGDIGIYQSVNRGTVNNSVTTVSGGTVDKFYVGGEKDDPSVTGTVKNVSVNLISGKISTLDAGVSNKIALDTSKENVSLVVVPKIIENSTIPKENIKEIEYTVSLEDTVRIRKGESVKIYSTVSTLPKGFENIIDKNLEVWDSADESIATVSKSGEITGVLEGETSVTVSLLDSSDTISVEVYDIPYVLVAICVILLIVLFILIMVSA